MLDGGRQIHERKFVENAPQTEGTWGVAGFSWEARVIDDLSVVVVAGDIDLATSDQMVATVADHLVSGGRMVLDISGVTFLDSCGLRGLLEISRNAEAAESAFALRAPSDIVLRVLELSGTLELFAVEDAAPGGQ